MRRILAACAAVLVVGSVAGCYNVAVTQAPPTSYNRPLLPTPWPNGTTGASGLRINPSLLSNVPINVGGSPLIEDVIQEMQALDDPTYASAFTSYYAARINDVTNPNWLLVTLEERKSDAQNEEFYTQWRDSWFGITCSQAQGLATKTVESIEGWQVDVGTCTGGVVAYVLALDNGVLVSMMEFGPRRLGRQLIHGIE